MGQKNRTTRILEQLGEEKAEQIARKVFEKASAGNEVCLRMLLDRVWPVRRGQTVQLDLPPLKTPADVLNAITLLWSAIGEGRFTSDEASALSLVAERSMQVISSQELLKRIEALEKDAELRDAANLKTP